MTRSTRFHLLVVIGVVAFLVSAASGACDQHEADAPEPIGALSSGGTFYVEWTTEPSPIPLNEMFRLHVRVLDPNDRQRLISGAQVTAGARMPAHNHGTTLDPIVTSHGDGTATAEGFLLHMEGHWSLRVGVAVDGQMERATFDLQVEP